jgi:hypothetical protein
MYLEDWILPSEINENTKQFYIEIWYLWQLLGQELFSCFKHTDVKWLFLKFLICGTDWQLTFNNFCCEIQYRPFYYLRTILSSSVFIVHLQPIGTAFQLHLVQVGRKGWTWNLFFSLWIYKCSCWHQDSCSGPTNMHQTGQRPVEALVKFKLMNTCSM